MRDTPGDPLGAVDEAHALAERGGQFALDQWEAVYRRLGGVRLLGHGPGGDPGSAVRREARGRLVELAGAGRLRVPVGATYPLTDAARAHRAGQAGTVTGKIVLLP